MNNEQRMDGSNMTVSEATMRARSWWQQYRGVVRAEFNRTQAAARTKPGIKKARTNQLGFPNIAIRDAPEQVVESGILSGVPWEHLTLREQCGIRELWHRNHVIAAEGRGKVIDIDRAGHGKLQGSELSPTPHKGKPERTPS